MQISIEFYQDTLGASVLLCHLHELCKFVWVLLMFWEIICCLRIPENRNWKLRSIRRRNWKRHGQVYWQCVQTWPLLESIAKYCSQYIVQTHNKIRGHCKRPTKHIKLWESIPKRKYCRKYCKWHKKEIILNISKNTKCCNKDFFHSFGLGPEKWNCEEAMKIVAISRILSENLNSQFWKVCKGRI